MNPAPPPDESTAMASAVDAPAFSNATEGDAWMDRYCFRCAHEPTCSLIMVALLGKTPAAWTPGDPAVLGERYTCAHFTGGR